MEQSKRTNTYLGQTDEEVAENERMWAEENGKGEPTSTDAAGELRSAGLSASSIEGDLGMAGDMTAPEDMQTPESEAGAPGSPGGTPGAPGGPAGGAAGPVA